MNPEKQQKHFVAFVPHFCDQEFEDSIVLTERKGYVLLHLAYN